LIVGRSEQTNELLRPSEYQKVARILRQADRQPGDLLAANQTDFDELKTLVDPDRLQRLLGRGFQLSQAFEHWQTRSIWVTGSEDDEYPTRFKERLKESAPAVLYGCGDHSLLNSGGLAVVGSREVNDELIEYAENIGQLAANAHTTLISGGARGIDQASMRGALGAGGRAIGVLADSLERTSLNREHREMLLEEQLTLLSPFDPSAGFNVGNAMQRNKLIYALADAALVVNSDYEKGGTWAGAIEQLEKFRFGPVYVRQSEAADVALEALRKKGAHLWPNPTTGEELLAALKMSAENKAGEQLSLL
jgi:predicted Rossmann fold nucleotide-binding protein DprA/Smf involved in DNA uptake